MRSDIGRLFFKTISLIIWKKFAAIGDLLELLDCNQDLKEVGLWGEVMVSLFTKTANMAHVLVAKSVSNSFYCIQASEKWKTDGQVKYKALDMLSL